MKERIVLAPGLNGAELIKSLAIHGVNCFGLRICSAAELARMALLRAGIPVEEDIIGKNEEHVLTANAIAGTDYFKSAGYGDVREISNALRRMRHLADEEDEARTIEAALLKGPFQAKNAALLRVYRNYMKAMSDQHAMDSIALIRKAAFQCDAFDASFLILEEYPLSPLELRLISNISNESTTRIKLRALFNAPEKPSHIENFKNCYGASNEVESILTDIYQSKSLDQCTVAAADQKTYGQLFFDCALLYDIPITFGCGIPVTNSNPAKLLTLYDHWSTGDFFSASSIRAMLSSDAFDQRKIRELFREPDEISWKDFLEILGDLRLTNDEETNRNRLAAFKRAVEDEKQTIPAEDEKQLRALQKKLACIPRLEIMAKELAMPQEHFIKKYTYIRKDSSDNAGRLLMALDLSAARTIFDELQAARGYGAGHASGDMLQNILRLNVCRQQSTEGMLHVTGISEASAVIRKNLYIAGLSASNFPGTPRENHLLLDADLKAFGDAAALYTSDGVIGRKRKALLDLVRLASDIDAGILVSFAGLNVSELKQDNPSSLIFELYQELHGADATVQELETHIDSIPYFEPAISASRLIGNAYSRGHVVQSDIAASPQKEERISHILDRPYSPTALETFFNCKRRFMLRYILGIPEPDEDDVFEVISARAAGTLSHTLMEQLANSSMSSSDFLKLSGACFDRYIAENPPVIAEQVASEREQFLAMMETAFQTDPGREVVLKEEDISCMHPAGVKIHGYPDRVEKLEDGSYLIADYKTGRNNKHERYKIGTYLQVILYAYIMEQERGYRISGCEYRYIRLGQTASCRYDEEKKKELYSLLEEFREHLQTGIFPPVSSNKNSSDCKYCKYKEICEKPGKEMLCK